MSGNVLIIIIWIKVVILVWGVLISVGCVMTIHSVPAVRMKLERMPLVVGVSKGIIILLVLRLVLNVMGFA